MYEDHPCSTQSAAHDEPIHGTAVAGIREWLFIEHDAQWDHEALESKSLDPRVRAHAEQWAQAQPGRRVQLFRGQPLEDPSLRRVFWFSSDAASAQVAEWTIPSWEHFLARDLETLAADATTDPTPFVFVCTHGRRDVCCARQGVPIYQGLLERLGDTHPGRIFQTSHLGGHRFAPTFVLMPFGHTYGRVTQAEINTITEAAFAGRLAHLEKYRGRSLYSQPAQLVACQIRMENDLDGPTALELISEKTEGRETTIVFKQRESGAQASYTVGVAPFPVPLPKSCGTPAVTIPRAQILNALPLAPR